MVRRLYGWLGRNDGPTLMNDLPYPGSGLPGCRRFLNPLTNCLGPASVSTAGNSNGLIFERALNFCRPKSKQKVQVTSQYRVKASVSKHYLAENG